MEGGGIREGGDGVCQSVRHFEVGLGGHDHLLIVPAAPPLVGRHAPRADICITYISCDLNTVVLIIVALFL